MGMLTNSFLPTNTNGWFTFQKGADSLYGGWDIQFSLASTSVYMVMLNTQSQGVSLSGNITLTNNTWYYVICQYVHNVGLRIYVNGVLANSLNQANLQMANRGTGWTINAAASSVKGSTIVSTFHMYTRVLTSE